MNDPTNFDTDAFNEGLGTFSDPAMAHEVAKRCNAYPGLIEALWKCRNASDDTDIHVMIDEIFGRLGEFK